MNSNQINNSSLEEVSNNPLQSSVKESYHAPQLKVHGKLERLTLQTTNSGGGTIGIPTETPGANG